MLPWEYPFDAATRRAAKSSVTALRRQAEELDDEADPMFQTSSRLGERFPGNDTRVRVQIRQLSAAATGTAHHKFLQHFAGKGG